MTDASDCGIGAYFYQVIDGVEKPIKFKKTLFTVHNSDGA
jgi:hypothetical protein